MMLASLRQYLNRLVNDSIVRLAALITGIEVVVLVEWLRRALAGDALTAAQFLFIGILIEEVVRFRGIKGRFPRLREAAVLVIGVGVETVGWILPLVLKAPPALTFGILFVFLEVEHAIISFATNGVFDLRGVLDFSAVEAAGGTIWLADPSIGTIVVLAITSILEHIQGIRQGLRLR